MRFLILFAILLMVSPVLAIDDPLENIPETPLVEIIAVGENLLDENDWHGFHVYQDEFFVRFAWVNDELGAVTSLEQIVFDSEDDKDEYFSDDLEDYFDTTFGNYEPFELTDDCEADGIELYEFDGFYDNEDYLIRLYLWDKDDETKWTASFYFPEDFEDELDETIEAFFPELISCGN